MKTFLAFIIAILFSAPFAGELPPREAAELFHKLDFAMLSDKPGSALTFRLKKNQYDQKILVCFRGACFRAQERWQILATDPNIPGKQTLVIFDEHSRATLRKIHLEGNLWSQAHQKIVQLRLPASVVQSLADQSDQIESDKIEDAELFTKISCQPWSTQWTLPIRSKVTSEFGSFRTPPHGSTYMHIGVDLRASMGTPVHATSDGIVVGTGDEVIYGNVVTVDHGEGLMTRYMHLSSFNVNVGERVKADDVIGLSGSTGRAEAPHLHWEMRVRGQPVDPLSTRLLLARLSDLK